MADRREKGLCFNCDERFSRNHRCKAHILLLIAEEDDDSNGSVVPDPGELVLPEPEPAQEPPVIIEELNSAQLSFHALSGV
ncbi:hypothetical protein L195_g008879 [Trifolium pratense]|uniref:Uncharacterized protein n=1 Tax=Trifolium pratense TaxID=57577 RepID=A0A2K3PAE1_TRIPR|nr:hypothetical protein L195_g008879 [Trifolium pratense]